MKYFLRQCEISDRKGLNGKTAILAILAAILAAVALAPAMARAQIGDLIQLMDQPDPVLRSSSQVYLGVEITDVSQEKAQALKLKETRGALVTLIDHDAPAAQAGIVVNDVILGFNGQQVQNAAQFLHMLHEAQPGHKVSIEISRDGNIQTLAVKLTDRRVLDHEVWMRIGDGGDVFPSAAGMAMLSGAGNSPVQGGFHLPFFGKTLNVGALVEPLTAQMAEYLGVASGLMVKQVARKSEAALAGLRAFDVILKIGAKTVSNVAGWDRALRTNQGKPVQVTILRDRKQQVLTLQVDSKHHQSALDKKDANPDGQGSLVADAAGAATLK
ncbi:MAG: PDZ domain-containing protein [Terracidiphilus sp.]